MSALITLLPTTTFVPDTTVTPIISESAKGAGYFNSSSPTHTAQYIVSNGFTGSILLQGTLAQFPTEDDWCVIVGTQYTRLPAELDPSPPIVNDSIVSVFFGNFVWIRAVVSPFTDGTINRIQYSHT